MKQAKQFLLGGLMALTAAGASATAFVGDRTDFRDETIYFAITTRFYDGDPTNNVLCWDGVEHQKKYKDPAWRGDFKGLIEKLDYIKALGFTAVWITPVVQNGSGFDYHGYHAMDFSEVDLRYKSRKAWGADEDVDFQDLIDAAHAKDMKVVLDIVLQHTGNFGENYLCHLFDREQNIKTQAKITSCLIPDEERLGGQAYWDLPNAGEKTQYSERFKYMKNTDGQNHDDKNYWHHVANAWNWDDPSRWWGQIAGDCVDLNTENPAVVDYIVECYGKFIEMGVDGFRIDTTGHIAPLTFNAAFIPRFIELGEKYKNKRLNQAPFYMFGECCARFGSVIYRDQHLLSSHYYTWKSDPALIDEWKGFTADWWAKQNVPEGAAPLGNMLTCAKDPGTVHNSDNVFMKNGAWHEPDYSDASGFNVIDFPMHYNFNSADQAVAIAKQGDHFYNDASWNVVYVDSHDYCPGPNDGVRFNGGTAQWAENLSLMFSFRGIPCIYYGSEVEFQKGKTIDKGTELALHESGRAYYGAYLEGSVSASDFGAYTASGNVEQTLNADLAQHIRRLNQIRAAVPALRKGQYTFDGCSANGGYAFKRAYKDSYALVAINGGATFTNVPAGTFVDLVTGKSYQGGGSITVDAPKTQGQLRVLVKDWTNGVVGEDGKFIYATSPVAHGGAVSFDDPGTDRFYTAEDAPEPSILSVKFNPGSGTFKTETLTVSVKLSDDAVSGWYQIAGAQKVNLTKGATGTFEIGRDMSFGQSVSVSWGANGEDGKTATGTVTYKKVDPNATITVYVKGTTGINMYAWGKNGNGASIEPCGAWPGKTLTETTSVAGYDWYYVTFDDMDAVNVIFNKGNDKTGDIENITEDSYFEWTGGSSYTKLEGIVDTPEASVKLSPNGGEFVGTVKVTATANSNTTSAWYKIGNGAQTNFTGATTFTLGEDMADGESVTVTWSATGANGTKTGSATYTKVDRMSSNTVTIFFDNGSANWGNVNAYFYGSDSSFEIAGAWPGKAMTKDSSTGYYKYTFETDLDYSLMNVIFNNGSGAQTGDNVKVRNFGVYNLNGDTGLSGVENVCADEDEAPVYFNLQGIPVVNPAHGFFIMKRGAKVSKVYIP